VKEASRDYLKDGYRDPLKESLKENSKEHNRDVPAFMRKAAAKSKERFDELKLVETPDFSVEDDERFDIPTFLRKQAD